jgi:MerR family copper efflux transcriptional regulator
MAELMHIGVVAERTELSIRTLRHYDEVGLVPPSARSEGGFRLYTEADVDRLTTIRRMKPLGFTLDEMGQLLDAVAVLNDPAQDEAARRAAADVVAECHQRAQQSSEKLRRHLAYAEELVGLLSDLGEPGVSGTRAGSPTRSG